MSFTLQQIVIPVAVLGTQPDPDTFAEWLDYFGALVAPMTAAMPCKRLVRISTDIAERMYGQDLPFVDPDSSSVELTQCGSDRSFLRVVYDRELPANTVRLE